MSQQPDDELRKILNIKPGFKTQRMEQLLAWRDKAVIDELNKVITDSGIGFMVEELTGVEVEKQLNKYYEERLAQLKGGSKKQ